MRSLLAALLLVACGPEGRPDGPGVTVDAPPVQPMTDAPATQDMSRVYAHSGTTLYRLDPTLLVPTSIGTMIGLEDARELLDLAVDKDDRILGITANKLYLLNATSGAASLIRELPPSAQGFTSLSFVYGANPADPDMLVAANNQGNVYRIDEVTGEATILGNYGTSSGQQIKSSGDLFGVRGLGIFATVDVGNGTTDYLAKIDPANGWKATLMPNATGFDKIFGLGYWNGTIYGFVDDGFDAGTGKMIRIDPTSGVGNTLNSGPVRWFGAGVATDTPVIF